MIHQQFQVQPDLPHMLGLVHDQRAPIADELAQFGNRLGFEIFAHGDVFTVTTIASGACSRT